LSVNQSGHNSDFRFRFHVLISDSDFRFRFQIQISDSDFRFNFQIQVSDSDFRFRFQIQISDFRFRFQIQISDSDFRFGFQIQISDSGFRFQIQIQDDRCVARSASPRISEYRCVARSGLAGKAHEQITEAAIGIIGSRFQIKGNDPGSGAGPVIFDRGDYRFGLAAREPKFNYYYYY
jgi:hypothetical protein